jgi:hypothetical protein
MGRTAPTEHDCLYSRAIPLLPLRAVRPVQSLSACTVELYLYFPYGPYGQYRASVPVQVFTKFRVTILNNSRPVSHVLSDCSPVSPFLAIHSIKHTHKHHILSKVDTLLNRHNIFTFISEKKSCLSYWKACLRCTNTSLSIPSQKVDKTYVVCRTDWIMSVSRVDYTKDIFAFSLSRVLEPKNS